MFYIFNILYFIPGLSYNPMSIVIYYTGEINTAVKISMKHYLNANYTDCLIVLQNVSTINTKARR